MSEDKRRDEIRQAAQQLAREAHCRYCDRWQGSYEFRRGYKCSADVEDSAKAIVELVEVQQVEHSALVDDMRRREIVKLKDYVANAHALCEAERSENAKLKERVQQCEQWCRGWQELADKKTTEMFRLCRQLEAAQAENAKLKEYAETVEQTLLNKLAQLEVLD